SFGYTPKSSDRNQHADKSRSTTPLRKKECYKYQNQASAKGFSAGPVRGEVMVERSLGERKG
ncbi:hypothetical protein, partial [Streptomyces sp. NRRL WC-3618]|uniref:hypothetical protein n=1 Tax=Streptomyces sp. NRRL WC-3618 TaxID=1519490 RepID=UPI001F440853